MSNSVEIKKIVKWIFSMILIFYLGFNCIYFGFYKLVNYIDNTIYYRYATDNKFDFNVYFNKEAQRKSGILYEISEVKDFNDLNVDSSIQEKYRIMNKNINEISNIMNKNKDYINYLKENNTSVEEAIEYINKMAFLDDKVLQISIYIVFLVMCFLTVVIFKYRNTFYCIAMLIYICITASIFSDGLSDYIVINIINIINKSESRVFSYKDIEELNFFLNPFKESMMTFIILDTLVQIWKNKKNEEKQYQVRYIIESLNIQIIFLNEQTMYTGKYIGKMKLPVNHILKECKRKIKELNRHKGSDKYIDKLDSWKNLRDGIDMLVNNSNIYSTKEYVEFLKNVRYYMVKCYFV